MYLVNVDLLNAVIIDARQNNITQVGIWLVLFALQSHQALTTNKHAAVKSLHINDRIYKEIWDDISETTQ